MKRFTIAIPDETHGNLRKLAKRHGITNNQIVASAIDYVCKNQDELDLRELLQGLVRNRQIEELAEKVNNLSEDEKFLLTQKLGGSF